MIGLKKIWLIMFKKINSKKNNLCTKFERLKTICGVKKIIFSIFLIAQLSEISSAMELPEIKRKAQQYESKITSQLSPYKHHRISLNPSSNKQFPLNLNCDDPAALVDYEWNGKSIAQLLTSDKKMLLRSADPEAYNFSVTHPFQTGDFNAYLIGKLAFQESVDTQGTALLACEAVKNNKDFSASRLNYSGQKFVNNGFVAVNNCEVEQCRLLLNKNKWFVKKDCLLKQVEKLVTTKNSDWTVGGTWAGTLKNLHLEGNASAGTAALFDVESGASFNGSFDTPILHAESKGAIECTPQSKFLTSHHLGLIAKESLACQGVILEKSCNQATPSGDIDQLHKLFQKGLFLQSTDKDLYESGTVQVPNIPAYLNAKKITTSQSSHIDAKTINMAAHEKIDQHGAINAQESLFQVSPVIEAETTSSITATNACINGSEKLSQKGNVSTHQALLMRSKQLYNRGTINAENSHFKADRWWLNRGTVNTRNESNIDALVSMNVFPGWIQAKTLKTNAIFDLNLLGCYKTQFSDINSILRVNAGLHLPHVNSWRELFTLDNLQAAAERALLLMNPPSVQNYYQAKKTLNNLQTTCKGIQSLYYQWLQLPKTYGGASDVVPLIAASANLALSMTQQIKTGINVSEGIKKDFHAIDLEAPKNPIKNPFNALASFKAIRSVAEPFFPTQNCKTIMDVNCGVTTGVNGQFMNILNLNAGASLFANSYKLDTCHGTDAGIVCAPDLAIYAARTYTGKSTSCLGAVEASIEANTLDVKNRIGTVDQVTLKAEKQADIAATVESNNKINVIAPEVNLHKECHLNTKAGAVSIHGNRIADAATIDAHLIHMQAKEVALKDGCQLNPCGINGVAVIQAENFTAENGSRFTAPSIISQNAGVQDRLIVVTKQADLQQGSNLNAGNGGIKIAAEKIDHAANINGQQVLMQANNVVFKDSSVTKVQGQHALVGVQANTFKSEEGASVISTAGGTDAKGDRIVLLTKQTELQQGSHFNAGSGAMKVASEKTSNAATIDAQIIHLQATDALTLKDGSTLRASGKAPLVVLQSPNLTAQDGSQVMVNATGGQQSTKLDDPTIFLDSKNLDLQKGSRFDPAAGTVTAIVSEQATIAATMRGKAQIQAKNLTLQEDADINLQDLKANVEEKIIQKANLNATKLFARANYVGNSGKTTTQDGRIQADRCYTNTGSLTSGGTLVIDAPASINWRSYTQAKHLITNSIIDINLLSCDMTQTSDHNALLNIDLSLHLPLNSQGLALRMKNGLLTAGELVLLAAVPEIQAAITIVKLACSIPGMANAGFQLLHDIKALRANPNAGASDLTPIINNATNLALAIGQTAMATKGLLSKAKQAPDKKMNTTTGNTNSNNIDSSKQLVVTNHNGMKINLNRDTLTLENLKKSFNMATSVAGSFIDQNYNRNGLIDLNCGLTAGINGNSTNLWDVSATKIFGNYNLNTCYGRNVGLLAAANLSISAKEYQNGASVNIGGRKFETPACIAGLNVSVKADSFKGSSNSTIATCNGGTSLETKEIDNKGTVHGNMNLKFTGEPPQLKSIGIVNTHGGNFAYSGPVAAQDGTNVPSGDELAQGSGAWGSIVGAREISCNTNDPLHIKQRHDIDHTFKAKTSGGICVDETLSSKGSIGLHAGTNLSHKSLIAGEDIKRVAETGSITAESTARRVQNGANYQDQAQRVSIDAGKSNDAYAGKNIVQTAVDVKSGKEGITAHARGNIVDNALEVEKHTERRTATESTKDTHLNSEVSQYTSTGNLQIQADGKYVGQAPKFDVQGESKTIQSGQAAEIADVHDVHIHESTKKRDGWWSSENTHKKTTSSESTGAQFAGHRTPFVIDSPETTLANPTSDENLILKGDSAKVLLGQNTIASTKETDYANWVYESKNSPSKEDVTYAPNKLAGIDNYTKKLIIQAIKGQTDDFLNKVNQMGHGTITPEYVEEYHYSNKTSSQRLTTGAKVVLGLAIGLATQGLAAPLGVGLAARGAGSAISTVLSQATTGTVTCLLNKAANTLVETKGDIRKAAQCMATCQTLRDMSLAALSAEAVCGAGQALNACGIPTVQDAVNFPQRLAYAAPRELINAGIKTGLSVLAGQSAGKALAEQAQNFAASTLHIALVSQIADFYATDNINSITHKVLHGAAGAAYGGIVGGKSGALAGGIGAFTAEVAAELLAPSKNIMGTITQFESEHGRSLTQQEFMTSYAGAMHDYMRKTLSAQQVAQLTAAVVAVAAGHDVAIAHQAAVTALDNNFLVLAFYGISAASTAYSGYKICKSYEQDGAIGALKQLGIEVAYNAAGQVIGRVGGMAYPSIKAAVAGVLDEAPALKLVLGNFAEKLIIAAEKINHTAIGQAVNKVEAALIEQESKLLARFGLSNGASAESELALQERHIAEHAVEHEQEFVLAGTGIKIKTDKGAQEQIAALSNRAEIVKSGSKATQPIKNIETPPTQLGKEITLPKMRTYEEARNKALELVRDVDYQNGYPHVGNLGTCENKLAGRSWDNNKVLMRLDYDPVKGPHINVNDYRLGKGIKAKKFAIPFEGNEETVKSLLKHLNTKASLEQAKVILTQTKDEANLGKLLEGTKNDKKFFKE